MKDFDYPLPKELIAQKPVSPRDKSRLLVLGKKTEHKLFSDILDYLNKGDVVVVNETKVMPAKITGKKQTGTKAEIIIESYKGKEAVCLIKTKNPRPGNTLIFGKYKAGITGNQDNIFTVVFNENVEKIMKKRGELPTPPYVKRKLDKNSQYQTVYAKKKGSVAAPTAGLHFTKRILTKIKAKGVKIAKINLSVSFGTFLPVRNIKQHNMHEEYFEIDKKNADIINKRKGKLIVVGTTSVRALESATKNKKVIPKKAKTTLFIKPGYTFKNKIDILLTNFHLPRSTLLILVSAFAGRKKILKAYKEAVKEKYRFYSFGDAMLILA